LAVSKWSVRESPLPIIDAFAQAAFVDAGLRLVLVGDGPLRAQVESRVHDLQLSERVHLPGYVSYEELPLYYGASDVFIHVPYSEPWGISVAEALACGVPVIASTVVGATADLLIHGVNGHLVAPGSTVDLTRAMLTVASWIPLGESRSTACRDNVERVGHRAAAEELERLVAEIDRQPGRPRIGATLRSLYRNHFGMWNR
jgi:glycosyltransferase involved in cell wall biosynthesis